MPSFTTDPLLKDTQPEQEEISAQCNCGAKIYYATREEMQRQIAALNSITVNNSNIKPECTGQPCTVEGCCPGPGIVPQSCGPASDMVEQSLPDMCQMDNSVELHPTSPDLSSQNIKDKMQSPGKCLQTSFITFKPPQQNYSNDNQNLQISQLGCNIIDMDNRDNVVPLTCNQRTDPSLLLKDINITENPYGVRGSMS